MRGVQVVYEDEDGLSWAQQRSGGRIMIITHIPHYSEHQEVLRSNGQNCRLFWATLKVWILPSESQRRKNLDSKEALLPGNFLWVRKVFACTTEKPAYLSQSCEDCPDRLRSVQIARKNYSQVENCRNIETLRISPDDFSFSGWLQNCLDFSRWVPIFRTISKLSGFSRWFPISQTVSKLSG